jgi:type IV pilus assembly protein PilM
MSVKSFLSVDFGAGTLKIAEFERNEAGGLRLKQFATKALGPAGAQESTREAAVLGAMQELLPAFSSRQVSVCAPGFHVFSKFIKLPPVDSSKVAQIVTYEAQQNVPFPLEEVVWDYQILGTSASGELEVLLVAIKTEIVEGMFRTAQAAGVRIELVDVSPAALCNAFRYNYGDPEGCTMLLDIGAKTSNLLFFEKGKVFARGISIGANSITQEFANEAKIPFAEAERIKIESGFVSLGGAYEEPEDPKLAAVSKIARQVLTRLHIQVNQTIQFYRAQQGGSAPQMLFLSGGGTVMTYTQEFFTEKLNVPVEYFNPFKSAEFAPGVNLEELSTVAHSFGEVVGLGLRNLAHCPVELNLMPKTSLQRQEFGQKKPYFIASILSLVLVVFAIGLFYQRRDTIKVSKISEVKPVVEELEANAQTLSAAVGEVGRIKKNIDELGQLVDDRAYWSIVLNELHRILVEVEVATKEKVGADAGVWVEKFSPVVPGYSAGVGGDFGGGGGGNSQAAEMDSAKMRATYMSRAGRGGGRPDYGSIAEAETPKAPMSVTTASTNELSSISCVIRSVNLSKKSPTANTDLVYRLRDAFIASPIFGEGTAIEGGIGQVDDSQITIGLNMTLKLKRPLKF